MSISMSVHEDGKQLKAAAHSYGNTDFVGTGFVIIKCGDTDVAFHSLEIGYAYRLAEAINGLT